MIEAIKKHAEECYPRECCGVVIVRKGKEKYIPCTNINTGSEFTIDPIDYAMAEDQGEIIMIVHSHPNGLPRPTDADIAGCEKSRLPWLIVSWPVFGQYLLKPTGKKLPLLGRQFMHGVVDCYTYIQDYYSQTLAITLPDFPRGDNWWLSGQDMYLDGFGEAGFVQVDDLQIHDVILMQVASPVANHGAVYVGNNHIEHHQVNRLSSRDVYGGWYRKISLMNLRHKALL